MNTIRDKPLMAIDVGNSQIMAGLFPQNNAELGGNQLPQPNRTLALQSQDWDPMELALWLAPMQPADFDWIVGSVCDRASRALQVWLESEPDKPSNRFLDFKDLTLGIEIPDPAAIGIDRLLGAVAANCVRPPNCPCIVIDLGSAITVDVISSQGGFHGGAILPGIQMSARALHDFTDRLPRVALTGELPPPPVGRSTEEAISSGIYWGTVGALRMLIDEMRTGMSNDPMVIVTGGNASIVAEALDVEVRCEPYLILSGIKVAVDSNRKAQRGI